jgi:hypothetical protein
MAQRKDTFSYHSILFRTALFRMATARYDAAVAQGDASRLWACGLSRVIDA